MNVALSQRLFDKPSEWKGAAMSELSDEIRLNDILWVDVEGYNEEAVWVGCHRPATTAEIMEAHPVCNQCKFMDHIRGETVDDWECDNDNSPCFGRSINPTTDYCNKWEAK
jgi:hypothetical protein